MRTVCVTFSLFQMVAVPVIRTFCIFVRFGPGVTPGLQVIGICYQVGPRCFLFSPLVVVFGHVGIVDEWTGGGEQCTMIPETVCCAQVQ